VGQISLTGWTVLAVNAIVVLSGLVAFARWLRKSAGKALERVVAGPVHELKEALDDLKKAVDLANAEASRANGRIDAMLVAQAYPQSQQSN